MDEHKARPILKTEKNLHIWLSYQQRSCKTKSFLNNIENNKLWIEFTEDNKYTEYILNLNDMWKLNLKKTIEYIDINNKKPNSRDDNSNIKKMGRWIETTRKSYKNKENIMKTKEIYDIWTEFINN